MTTRAIMGECYGRRPTWGWLGERIFDLVMRQKRGIR
ncbi:predicted protein [Streptomyces filamentosus NRRL 15998]|uniref:Predicted protein n=1 Tax=Streptomyces filamentosus NRRL 15998 TaxID=457431 RepID=D6AG13_STRFL|nr:predicted protein [Streptomyces filamentosus NRRL 15998]